MIKIREIKYQNGDKEHGQSRVLRCKDWSGYINDLKNKGMIYNPTFGDNRLSYDFLDGDDWFTLEAMTL